MHLKIIRLLFIFYGSNTVFAVPVIQTLLPHGGLFSLECEYGDSVLQCKEELTRYYGEKLESVTGLERYPFAYLPLLRRDAFLSPHFQRDLPPSYPIDKHEENTDKEIVTCTGIESYSPVSSRNVYSSPEQVNSLTKNSAHLSMGNPSFSYSYRFTDTVFSWENHHSLINIREEDALIPTALLDAILRSNFELFFLQKQISDEELHAVYLNILHGSTDHTLAKAAASNFSDLTNLFLLFGVFCFFIQKYLRSSQANLSTLETHTLHSDQKTSRFTRK
ncbi:MAG: hypothetical protein ACJZ64_03930 [Opitutales bacterium]